MPPPLSAVHKGTAFEDRSLRLLEAHLSMSLRRVGGKDDGGVDLQGWWWLPALTPADPHAPRMRLRVLAQCKDEKRKLSPKYVRELEGVLYRYLASAQTSFARADADADADPVVGLLVSSAPYTKATLLRAHSSPMPLVLLHIPPALASDSDAALDADALGAVIFNHALNSPAGVLRGQVEPRWEHAAAALSASGVRGRPGLWFHGQRIASWTPEQV